MQYENLLGDLKELLKITKFVSSNKETKKYRKKLKKMISKIEEGELSEFISDVEY